MLVTVSRLIRLAACLFVGGLTFIHTPVTGTDLGLEIAAYAFGMITVGYWWFLDVQDADPPLSMRWNLGLMALVPGLFCLAPNAGGLIAFGFIAVITAATDGPELIGWIVGAVAVLSVNLGAVIWQNHDANQLGYTVALLIGFVSGRNRHEYVMRARQSAAMLVQMEQLRAEQHRVAVLDERNRIAREIHDVLAHSLGALGIQLQVARAVLTDHGDVDRAVGLLEQAQRMATDGLTDSRRAIQALREDSVNLDEQLAVLVETHRQRHTVDVELRIEGRPHALTPEATVALIRTAQEALVNTAKHAPQQPVQIRLSYDEDQVQLTVINPLAGAGDRAAVPFSSVNGGYGLTGMRERLLLINGTLTTGSDDRSWTVAAQVPR
jgi:signal transduction histidine kinase